MLILWIFIYVTLVKISTLSTVPDYIAFSKSMDIGIRKCWKEEVSSKFEVLSRICLERLRKWMRTLVTIADPGQRVEFGISRIHRT
jgi:hypothetical protein